MEVTQIHNYFLDKFRGKVNTTIDQIKNEMKKSEYYVDATDEEIDLDAEKIFEKLQIINQEFMKWYEILLSFIFALIGYMAPYALLIFQAKMRQIEMEDEVMQFQTIILMLMRIERVNVEIIHTNWIEIYIQQ